MDKKESKSQDDDGWTVVVSKKTIKKKKYQKRLRKIIKKKSINAVIGSREYVEQKNYIPRKNTWINAKNKLKCNLEK